MKIIKRLMTVGCAAALSMGLASCRTAETGRTAEETGRAASQAESTGTVEQPEDDPESRFYNKALENSDLLSGVFFKAGDIRDRLTFSLRKDSAEADQMEFEFSLSYNSIGSGTIETEKDQSVYELKLDRDRTSSEIRELSCRMTLDRDDPLGICIRVEGDDALAGDYYPFKNSFTFPDVFVRYLCSADLCLFPTEDLKLLRNEVYAAHGRKFNSDVLNDYFSGKSWYRGIIEPGDFSEELLSDVERKNIEFIQKMENNPDRNWLDGERQYSLEDLPPADYLPLLGRYNETGLTADLAQAKDMGAYFLAPGTLSVPASITLEQYKAVSAGETVEVVLNQLTGERAELSLAPDDEDGYGYLLTAKGKAPSEYGYETGLTLDFDTMEYQLWQDSADTVMKIVYEGGLCIMKGAVTGSDASLAKASECQQEITNSDMYPDLGGNRLFYNERGYFTAVYYIGD